MNKNGDSIDSLFKINNGLPEIECFWCFAINNLSKCKSCQRIFCKSCLIRVNKENEEYSSCILCILVEINKEKIRISLAKDMLQRFGGIFDNGKLSQRTAAFLDDIDSIGVDEFPILLNILLKNICSMMNDFQKLSTMLEQATKNNKHEETKDVYLPLFKMLTKNYFFNRLGRPSRSYNLSPEHISDMSDECNDRLELSPKNVSREEININVAELKCDDNLIFDTKLQIKDLNYKMNLPECINSKCLKITEQCVVPDKSMKTISKERETLLKCNPRYVSLLKDIEERVFICENPGKADKKRSWENINSKKSTATMEVYNICDIISSNKNLTNSVTKTPVSLSKMEHVLKWKTLSDGNIMSKPKLHGFNSAEIDSKEMDFQLNLFEDNCTRNLYSETMGFKADPKEMDHSGSSDRKYSIEFSTNLKASVKDEPSVNEDVFLEDFDKSKFKFKKKTKNYYGECILPLKRDEQSDDSSNIEYKRNSHLVAPATITEERSFIIKDIDTLNIHRDNHTLVGKKWSWEKVNKDDVIPLRYKDRGTKKATLSKVKYNGKNKNESQNNGSKKKGRPRKYFHEYET